MVIESLNFFLTMLTMFTLLVVSIPTRDVWEWMGLVGTRPAGAIQGEATVIGYRAPRQSVAARPGELLVQ